jgi:UrcA family protein
MKTSTYANILSGSLPVALATLALAAFSAAAYAEEPYQITIVAAKTKTIGRDAATNAPIQQTTTRVAVPYDPVTLTTNSGVALLNDAVADAARKACAGDDPPSSDDQTCVNQAINSAQPQIARAIAKAKSTASN